MCESVPSGSDDDHGLNVKNRDTRVGSLRRLGRMRFTGGAVISSPSGVWSAAAVRQGVLLKTKRASSVTAPEPATRC